MSWSFLSANTVARSRQRSWQTPEGTIFVRDFCTESFVESLTPDACLRAFARAPAQEHQLLKKIAAHPDSILTLAYTENGTIIGQTSLVPVDGWWRGLTNAYEIAVEVSTPWRQQGIARKLLSFLFELDELDRLIIIGMGLTWHWDMQGLQLTPLAYRAMIERLFASYGFAEYLTSEGNIRLDPANIFLARLGCRAEQEDLARFYDSLLQDDMLSRM